MPLFEFDGWRTRDVREGGVLDWVNREAIKLISQMRDALQRLPLWGVIPWGENESDIPLMTRVDGELEPAWAKPRAAVEHLQSSELAGGVVDLGLANIVHLQLQADTALVIEPPTLTARDAPNGIKGSSAHCALVVYNDGGFTVTSWSANVKHKGGTAPSLATMTAGQWWFFSLYVDGTTGNISAINSGPFG
jgi:hypothetical protein